MATASKVQTLVKCGTPLYMSSVFPPESSETLTMPPNDTKPLAITLTIVLQQDSSTLIILSRLASAARVPLETMVTEALVFGAAHNQFWEYIRHKYLLGGRRLGVDVRRKDA